jgi:hypothetical protein
MVPIGVRDRRAGRGQLAIDHRRNLGAQPGQLARHHHQRDHDLGQHATPARCAAIAARAMAIAWVS